MVDESLLTEVDGNKKDHDLLLFALSTCGWCKKARKYLDDCDVSYRYVYVDKLKGETLQDVVKEVEKYNPDKSFPTLVIDGGDVLKGFNEGAYAEKLK